MGLNKLDFAIIALYLIGITFSGFSGECIRTGKALRCDDSETDSRVEAAICRRLGVRFSWPHPSNASVRSSDWSRFSLRSPLLLTRANLAILERLAQTVRLTVSQAQLYQRSFRPACGNP